MGERRQRNGEGPREAEVCDLHVAQGVDEDVLGLEVAVDDPVAVAV